MSHAAFFLSLFLCAIQLNCFAQKEDVQVITSDFGLTSPYYDEDNTTFKLLIHKHLSSLKDGEKSIRTPLTKECIISEELVHLNDEPTNNLTSQLNSMGSLTYCITKITNSGDIEYRRTYSGNLQVTIVEETLKR